MSRHRLRSTRFPVKPPAHWFADGTVPSCYLYPPVHPAGLLNVSMRPYGRAILRRAWSARAALLVRFAQPHPLKLGN